MASCAVCAGAIFFERPTVKINDAVSGVILLLLSLAVLFSISAYPKIPGQNVGPAAFPAMVALLLAACAIGLIWRGVRAKGPWLVPGPWLKSGPHVRNFLLTNLCLVFYILVSDKLGFIPSAALVLAVMFWTLRVRPAFILPLSVGVTLLIHLIFYKGLRVPLPWGVLLPWQW